MIDGTVAKTKRGSEYVNKTNEAFFKVAGSSDKQVILLMRLPQ